MNCNKTLCLFKIEQNNNCLKKCMTNILASVDCEKFGNIGNFLTGIAAILAFFFWRRSAKVNRLNLRSSAAALVLSQFRKCIGQVEDISYKFPHYQYPSFPDAEATSEKEEKSHRERPPRLVSLKIALLKKDLHEPIAQISGKASLEILDLLVELEKLGTSIGAAIYGELGGYTKEIRIAQQDVLPNASSRLQLILQNAEKILFPIIDLEERKIKISYPLLIKGCTSLIQKIRKRFS